MTGSPGGARAAAFIAGEMRPPACTPAGDSGYYQRLPLVAGQNWPPCPGGELRRPRHLPGDTVG